jgi:hypothetical protein
MSPKLSAWEQLYGVFDYNATPLGPPSTLVLVHDKPQNHGTWAPHGHDTWYIGLHWIIIDAILYGCGIPIENVK